MSCDLCMTIMHYGKYLDLCMNTISGVKWVILKNEGMLRNLYNLYDPDHDKSSEEVCKCDSYNTTFSPEEQFKP